VTASDPGLTADPAAAADPRWPLYLDCDTGVDDALALAYLAATPVVDLLGVGSVSGNIDAATGARNTLDLLALLGRSEVPVAVGAHDPLAVGYRGGAPHVHGGNGIGGVVLPPAATVPVAESAAELLVRLAHEHPGRLRVLAIGPLTNLALALRLEPRLPELVAEVTIMGGAALVPGNVTPVAEANIHNDPEAAAEVFDAPWPILLVPLDVTMDHALTERHRRQILAIDHPVAPYLGSMLAPYLTHYADVFGEPACAMHDPLAAALAVGGLRPGSAPTVRVVVDAGDGPGRGQTVCDLRGRHVGHPEQPGAHCRVVLTLAEPFSPHLVTTLQRLAPTVQPTSPALTVVGSINLDLTAVGERLPGPGETVGGATLHRQTGGKGANQAVAAARLAGRSRFVGAVGHDADGARMLAELSAAGVDVAQVTTVDAPTGTALIVVDAAGENQIAVCPGANALVDLTGVEFADDETVLCQLEIELEVVVEAALRHRGYFALNAAPARSLPAELIERCDLIIVNESEYALIPELADAALVAVTYGGDGSALLRRGERVAGAPSNPTEVINTVGAGDAFCAALVLALRSGLDEASALAAANAVGARAVADSAAQPAFDRLEHYLPRAAPAS
jgi:purine nucleosidase